MCMSKRIRERRVELGLTQEELAFKLDLQKSAIAKYESGRVENIKRPTIEKMSKILQCRPSYLMGWDDKIETPNFTNVHPITKKRLPVLGDIACGEPIYADQDRESYVMVGTDINADFCLIAKGDSMIGARIIDGDVVFIRKQDTVNNGEIAAVIINDEATLKRVFYYSDKDLLILKAENPKYQDMIYQDSELENIHIIGKAVGFQSDVK